MENAADALKISFAVFIFVFAVAVAFSVIAKAKTTGDVVLYYSDKTNFYETEASKETNRVIEDYSEIISTLYRSISGAITVSIKDSSGKDLAASLYNKSTGVTEEDINNFIKDNLNTIKNQGYVEEFVEVPYSGIYKTGDDGSQITISSGDKWTYITYIPYT